MLGRARAFDEVGPWGMLCCAFHERQLDTRTTQPKLKTRPGMRIAIRAFVSPEQTPMGLAMDAGWTPES
jgi:hypothetical protein